MLATAALGAALLFALNSGVEADAGGVPPVDATFHGPKPYSGFAFGGEYDAWSHGDIVMFTPPGQVTKDMADQWLAWQATTDNILRTLIADDEHFEQAFRGNMGEFQKVKSIATPPDSCGAGCGNKHISEGVGIIDKMVAEPDNYEHQWILFYEQARGGRDESFDLAATWPREAYHLPHLVAALTFYEIDGMEGLKKGVPADIYNGLEKWANHGTPYTEVFVEREQRWFDDKFADGTIIYPPQTSILLHIGVNDGLETLSRVLNNLGEYPDNFLYENSTDAMCDWQAAVNDATGDKYAVTMVAEWHLPADCSQGPAGDAPATATDGVLRFEASGLCARTAYKPNALYLGSWPCDGSPEQQYSIHDERGDGTFSIKLGPTGECLDASGTKLVVWKCHGAPNQIWEWSGDQLRQPYSDLCLTAPQRTRWGGGMLRMEPCTDSPTQRVNTGGAPTPPPAPPVTEPPSTTTTVAPTPSVTEAPTTSTTADPSVPTVTEAPTTSTTVAPTPSVTEAPTTSTTLAEPAPPTVTEAPTTTTTVAPAPPVSQPPIDILGLLLMLLIQWLTMMGGGGATLI